MGMRMRRGGCDLSVEREGESVCSKEKGGREDLRKLRLRCW